MILLIILAVIILITVLMIVGYNNLVKLRARTNNAWGQIDILLQKRFDLIPNLVETVKGYAAHEKDVLEDIAQFRTRWTNAGTVGEKAQVEAQMEQSLKSVMAVAESYPDLKADQGFLALQSKLDSMESEIAFARQFYNDIITKYNTQLGVFPSNIIAKLFGFEECSLFRLESEDAGKNVTVQF